MKISDWAGGRRGSEELRATVGREGHAGVGLIEARADRRRFGRASTDHPAGDVDAIEAVRHSPVAALLTAAGAVAREPTSWLTAAVRETAGAALLGGGIGLRVLLDAALISRCRGVADTAHAAHLELRVCLVAILERLERLRAGARQELCACRGAGPLIGAGAVGRRGAERWARGRAAGAGRRRGGDGADRGGRRHRARRRKVTARSAGSRGRNEVDVASARGDRAGDGEDPDERRIKGDSMHPRAIAFFGRRMEEFWLQSEILSCTCPKPSTCPNTNTNTNTNTTAEQRLRSAHDRDRDRVRARARAGSNVNRANNQDSTSCTRSIVSGRSVQRPRFSSMSETCE